MSEAVSENSSPAAAAAPRRAPAAAGPRLPELLAPAGDWECARAAVENGADAIYFGLEKFNARMRAQNFTAADLPALMEYLHRRGVRGYVTFNTLVFPDEMEEAERWIRAMIASGADAAVVQDAGVCRLIRRISPDFPMHASTQMTISSAAGVEFARALGCEVAVLARECSISEIAAIQSKLAERTGAPFPLEVFVHGALCVAYSGQCLTSESLGGRSANRGECAQACRMPYELVTDGRTTPLGDRRYLLSPQDLSGLEVLPELVRAGVASLKIEGRLKSPEYVANITRIYRQALDEIARRGWSAPEVSNPAWTERWARPFRYPMEMSFSRGLSTGWLRGINHQELAPARFGKKRGVYLGAVAEVGPQKVRVRLQAAVKPGDGVVFDQGQPELPEEGGRIYGVEAAGDCAWLSFGRGRIQFNKIHAGDGVWKTSDPELESQWRATYAKGAPRFQRPIAIEARGAAGQPLRLIAHDQTGCVARVQSEIPLAGARTQPLTDEVLRRQLSRLGATPFYLDRLENHIAGPVLLPLSELNRLRRELVSELERKRAQPPRWTLNEMASRSWIREESARAKRQLCPTESDRSAALPRRRRENPAVPELIVLIRQLSQLAPALRLGVRTVYCEFEDPKKYREAVQQFRAAAGRCETGGAASDYSPSAGPAALAPEIYLAPPRIFKTGEEWILRQAQSAEPDGYLIRNYDHLGFFRAGRRIGDYSLNISNALSADYFKTEHQLDRLTASYDLNIEQLEALLRSSPPQWFEVTIHQHMPMFHMEHCLFCAFLSSGKDYRDCGRPCEKHAVELRDRAGARHPLKADAGCRNTLYNGIAQTSAEFVPRLIRLGARRFRLELLDETPEQAERIIRQYQQLLRGEINGNNLWRDLKLVNQLGVTRGPMAV